MSNSTKSNSAGPNSARPQGNAQRGQMVVPVAELLRRPGSHRSLLLKVDFVGLANSDAEIKGPAELQLRLESNLSGIEATGTITTEWSGSCRRCLAPICQKVSHDLREQFSSSANQDETYPLSESEVDLAPMIRDCLVLALPIAPLCSQDCAGPAPDTHPMHQAQTPLEGERDPRWAALDALRSS